MHTSLLSAIPDINIIGPPPGSPRAPLLSFTVPGVHCQDLGTFLNLDGIMVRTGFHCTEPLHGALNAGDMGGTLRASLGIYNDREDVDIFVEKLGESVDLLRGDGGVENRALELNPGTGEMEEVRK